MRSWPCSLRVLSAASALATAFFTGHARAAEPFGVESPSSTPSAPGGTEQAVVARYFELGRVRPFFALTAEAGYGYVKPRFAFGYGRPFWSWIGVEVYPLTSLNGVGGYGGINLSLPGFAFRSGARYYYPFSRTALEPAVRFDRSDLDILRGPKGDYMTLEAELTGTIPLFAGSLFAVLTAYRTALVQRDHFLFEDSLRAVMKPPYIGRGRLGYLLAVGVDGALRIGPAADVIVLPGRDFAILRAGVLGSVLISPSLEAQASFIPVIMSRDNLGLLGGDFGQLGVRYRWATQSEPEATHLKKPPVKR
jgi:hypothetical protein